MSLINDEVRLTNFVNASSEGIFIHDKGNIVDINPSITKIYGYEPDETVGKNLLEFIAPESKETVLENLARQNEGPYEVTIFAKDGTKIPSEVRAKPIEYHGRSLRAVALLDISQRRLAETALKESEKKYHTLFDSTVEGVFLLKGNEFIECNERACQLWACERNDILGKNPIDFSPDIQPDGRKSTDTINQILSDVLSGQAQSFYYQHKRKDDVLIDTNITLKLIELGGEKTILASMEDITARKLAEEQNNTYVDKLRKLAKFSMAPTTDPAEVFQEATKLMGELIDVPIVALTEVKNNELNFINIFAHGEIINTEERCSLQDTPCSTLIETKDIIVLEQVSNIFPEVSFLKPQKNYSYCAFPALDSTGKKVIAIINLLDDKQRYFSQQDQDLLRVFSQRIGLVIERKNSTDTIQDIANAISAQTGEVFFESLVNNLSTLFDVKYTFIGVIDEQNPDMIKTLALCIQNEIVDNVSYEIAHTPCEHVLDEGYKNICTYPCNIQQLFPDDPLLQGMEVQSYIGAPLIDMNGKPVGLISVMDNKPLENTNQIETILKIFAVRAAAELVRLQTKKELTKQKAEFEAMFNSIPDAVMFTDLNRRIILSNPAVHKMLGYSNEELIGNTSEILYANKQDYEDQGRRRYTTGEKTEKGAYEIKYRHKNGHEFWTETLGTKVIDATGNPIGFLGLLRDITDRKNNENALLRSERRLANAQRMAHIGSWELDLTSNKLECSEEIFNILEIDPKTFSASYGEFLVVIHPDDQEYVIANYTASIKNRNPYQIEYRLKMTDGRIKHILEACEYFYTADGEAIRSMGTVQDITERVMSENKIRYNEARLAESQEIAHLGSWDTNIQTGETIWSEELYKLLGYKPNEVEASPDNFYARVHKDDIDHVKQELERPFNEPGHEYQSEFRIVLPNNTVRIVSEHGKIIRDQQGNPSRYVGTTLDITERRDQEEKLRRSQKMDALGKLTGGIAHDYNNLLGIIVGYAEQLNNQLDHDKKLSKYARVIKNAAERGTRLTSKLLGFSKFKSLDATVLNINTIFTDQQLLLEKTLTARIKLTYNLANDIWPIEVDSSELEDSVLNICINAKHAMRESGEFIIQTNNKTLSHKDAQKLHLETGDYVQISLTDTGIGMDSATKERVFEPFFTTKGEGGTGLGLSQVYGFVERCGGTIVVHSEPKQGSCFELFFPRSKKSLIETHYSATTEPNNFSGNETILVVDDEKAMVELAYEILNEQGYKVHTANNGLQALDVLEKIEHPVDLVITDVIMPDMDGYQLVTHIKERYPRIQIQMVSGFADDRYTNMADETLFHNMLYKPYTANALLIRIRSLLDKNDLENTQKNQPETILSGRTILILDDEEDVHELYKLNLKKLGCTVLTANSDKEALQLYQFAINNGETIDAIIVDLSIPGSMGGKAVADQIHEWDPKVKIIVSSGFTEGPEMTNYKDYGFQGALDKDFDRKKIKEVLETVLESD